MNKILLLTTVLAIIHRTTWAQDVASVEIIEYGDVLTTEADALVASIGSATIGSGLTGATVTNIATSGGSGTGLTLDITYSATAVTGVTVNNPGTGYVVDDAITVSKQDIDGSAATGDITITLVSNDFDNLFTQQGKLTKGKDVLVASIDSATIGSGLTGTTKTNIATSGGSGTGLTLDITYSATAVTAVTVNNAGFGYAVGDAIKVSKQDIDGSADTGDITITLEKQHFPGLLRVHHGTTLSKKTDELLEGFDSLVVGSGLTPATKTGQGTTGGSGSGLTLDITYDETTVTSVTVNNAGSGYAVGDAITVAKNGLTGAGSGDITLTLVPGDFIGGYRDAEGLEKQFAGNSEGGLGYYLPLQKLTAVVQVRSTFDTSASLTPTMGTTTDATLVSGAPSQTVFPVSGGLNIMKVVSSIDGNYEFNLIKPDDNIKHVQGSKRSLEIAYNPGVVGEFTCAAFTNDATPPTSRANVEANGIAKSVRTHNILQENIFNSLQMTLNGLSPSTQYDIYCYHLSHGIISNTAASVKTDLASLTAVSLAASNKIGNQNPTTITLTFTHEASLGATNTIKLSLYNDFDTKQAIADGDAVVTDCRSKVAITNGVGGNTVGVTSCAESGTNELLITLSGSPGSTVSGSSGNVMVVTLTNDASVLKFESNAAAGTKVTFNLEVFGHGKLLQQTGWTTTAS